MLIKIKFIIDNQYIVKYKVVDKENKLFLKKII